MSRLRFGGSELTTRNRLTIRARSRTPPKDSDIVTRTEWRGGAAAVCVCVEAGRAGPVVVHCSGSNPALLDAAAAWCAAADTESGGGPACGGESVSAEASEMLWNGINGC